MSRWSLPSAVVLACSLGLRAAGADKPAADEAVVMRYVELLKDDSPLVRKRAALALKRLGRRARAALPALEKALTDKDKGVREAVAEALEAIDPDVKPAPKPGAPDLPPAEKPPDPPGGVGSFVPAKDTPSLLLRRKHSKRARAAWQVVSRGGSIHAEDDLLSLPGSMSLVRLNGPVELLLRGLVPPFSRTPEMFFLLESTVTLHRPSKGVDADLTFSRGRIYLSNPKREGSARVRLRFDGETWDLTLQTPGAEVGIDFLKAYTRDDDYRAGDAPCAELYLSVLKGAVKLQTKESAPPLSLEAPPGRSLVIWDNKGKGLRGPFVLAKGPPVWKKELPTPTDPHQAKAIQKMTRALAELGKRLAGDRIEASVEEGLDGDEALRQLSIFTLGALDNVPKLLDVLGDARADHAADRDSAVFTLRRWLGRGAGQGTRLYDPKTRTGLLLDARRYNRREAEILFDLLHHFSDRDSRSAETFELLARLLESPKVAIAHLAFWQLQRLAGDVVLPPFNAGASLDMRRKAADKVMDLIRTGKLPPFQRKP